MNRAFGIFGSRTQSDPGELENPVFRLRSDRGRFAIYCVTALLVVILAASAILVG